MWKTNKPKGVTKDKLSLLSITGSYDNKTCSFNAMSVFYAYSVETVCSPADLKR